MDNKFDYPSTKDYPTREYPSTRDKITMTLAPRKPEGKQPNKFVRFLKFVFVKNIGLKIAAILTAAAMCVLIVGLS